MQSLGAQGLGLRVLLWPADGTVSGPLSCTCRCKRAPMLANGCDRLLSPCLGFQSSKPEGSEALHPKPKGLIDVG